MTRPGGVSSSPGLSQDQLWIKSAVDTSQTFGQAGEPGSGSINLSLQLSHLTLLFAGSSLSAHVSFSEQIDVAVVLGHDHVVKILVIEALALAGLVAYHLVVVQVDLHIIQVLVFESVILFCFAGIFHNCVLYPWLVIGLIA